MVDARTKIKELEAIAKRNWDSMSLDARKRFMRDMNRYIEEVNRGVRSQKKAESDLALDEAVENAARKIFN